VTARYAIYYTPPAASPLARAAAAWLGRDAFTNAAVEAPPNPILSRGELAFHAAAARRYGFHATLKAPFRLAEGQTEAALEQALQAFCLEAEPVTVPRLAIGQLDGFFALLPEGKSPDLDRLAGEVVLAFERFRAPASEAEIERRNPDALSPAALRNLCRWGYPYVFELFRFHMTLTGRVGPGERDRVAAALAAHFASVIPEPFEIGSLALFVEPEPGAPFEVRAFHSLGRGIARKTA
jgi:putative phosphonate metabolism protein